MDALRSVAVLLLVSMVSVSGQRDEWCEGDHDHDHDDDHELPHPEDFLVEVFKLYGDNATCTIDHHEFEHLLEDLNIGQDSHAPHSVQSSIKIGNRALDHTCYDSHDLMAVFNVSEEAGLSQDDFMEMCPAFIQQIVQGCQHEEDHDHDHPTKGEVWGYSMASVLIVGMTAFIGLIIARWRNTAGYKYLLTVMLGLAAGTLLADSLMHLIPHSLGIHAHDDGHSHDETSGVEDYVWKTLLACLAALGFFDLQMGLKALHRKGASHSHGPRVSPMTSKGDLRGLENGVSLQEDSKAKDVTIRTNDSDFGSTSDVTQQEEKPQADDALGWMVVVGDGLHNLADGLAIAAAYSDSVETGLGTTIAIFCHELPHEFGDVAAMLSCGWSWKKVLLMQVVSQSVGVLGVIIGVPVSENQTARDWILILTAGMFLYIALADIIPELLEYYKAYDKTKIFLLSNAGILFGFLLMVIIAVLEGTIHLH